MDVKKVREILGEATKDGYAVLAVVGLFGLFAIIHVIAKYILGKSSSTEETAELLKKIRHAGKGPLDRLL